MLRRSTPGSEAIGSRIFSPSRMKIGQIRSETFSCVSCTRLRIQGVRRVRRERLIGKGELGRVFYMEADYVHNLRCQAEPDRFNLAIGMNWWLQREHPGLAKP